MDTIVGTIPEFSSDEGTPSEPVQEEVKPVEETVETETPAPPAEKQDDLAVVPESPAPSQDETEKAIQGLQNERVKLLKEISELKGTKREIKQERLESVQAQIDELKDVAPEDQAIMEKFLRAKGMVSKKEVETMFYEAVKTEELNRFLDKYPEYKPENDPGDVNWSTLQRELAWFTTPKNPRDVATLLEKAHGQVFKVPVVSQAPAKRQVQLAGVGAGGVQNVAPKPGKIPAEHRAMLKGFSDEDIQDIEKSLT